MLNKKNKKNKESTLPPILGFALGYSVMSILFSSFESEDITSILLHLVPTLLLLGLVLYDIKKHNQKD